MKPHIKESSSCGVCGLYANDICRAHNVERDMQRRLGNAALQGVMDERDRLRAEALAWEERSRKFEALTPRLQAEVLRQRDIIEAYAADRRARKAADRARAADGESVTHVLNKEKS